ncbi:hypothetical protein FALCPG4_008679 [Fusarium falciforme]
MAASIGQGWSNPLPSLLPMAEPLEEDETGSETGFIAEFGFGPPLDNRKEAEYFMHFIHELAPWFDVCDPARHFGTEVPKRARHFPFLAYSILAFSSRQISLKSGIPDDSHETYHSHALRILIPILDDPIGAVNENVLAGIVILRSYEEMTDMDGSTHLTGSSRLLNSEFRFAAQGGLGEAASWVVLRQDMYVSLTRSRPLRTNMDSYRDSQSFVDTCDESLANRVVFICGRVLAYAFGPESRLDPVLWAELGEDLRRWYEATPWKVLSWSPDSPAREGGEKSVFPTLWMARHIQVLGYQHYYIARMLLNIFDPQLWTPGFDAIRLRAASDESVRKDLRTLLGLTISNPNLPTAYFTAHHTLYACGVYLKDVREHQEVFRFLEDMSNTMGWPTREVAAQLRKDWGLDKGIPENASISPHQLSTQRFSGDQAWDPEPGVWGQGSPMDKEENSVIHLG